MLAAAKVKRNQNSMPRVTTTRKPTKAQIAARIRAAGERAKAEAQARRHAASNTSRPKEIGGQKGPEPTRFGDWEKNGLASDF
jgi:hypothetical protein